MSEEINVTLNINELLRAYDKKDFMQKVFKDVLKENPEIFASHIKDYILKEIMISENYDEIKKNVHEKVTQELNEDKSYSGIRSVARKEIDHEIADQVRERKKEIGLKVSIAISDKMTKERISSHISNIVEERVMRTLGEVCEGCDRDYY